MFKVRKIHLAAGKKIRAQKRWNLGIIFKFLPEQILRVLGIFNLSWPLSIYGSNPYCCITNDIFKRKNTENSQKFDIQRESERKPKVKTDRHGNIKNINKTEHDIQCTYQSKTSRSSHAAHPRTSLVFVVIKRNK